MITMLVRLVIGNRVGGFWVGLAIFLTGLVLTVVGYMLAPFIGGTYIIFSGAMIVGLIRMVMGAPALFAGGNNMPMRAGHARPLQGGLAVTMNQAPMGAMAPMEVPIYMAPPAAMPAGYCWMCGGSVKPGRPICLHCGATLPAGPSEPSSAARLLGFNAEISSSAIPRHVGPSAVPSSAWNPTPGAPPPAAEYPPPGQYPPPRPSPPAGASPPPVAYRGGAPGLGPPPGPMRRQRGGPLRRPRQQQRGAPPEEEFEADWRWGAGPGHR